LDGESLRRGDCRAGVVEVALTKLTFAAVAHAQGRAADACAYLDDALPALRNQGPPRVLEAGEQLVEAIRPQSGGTPR
jgi:hypothetical protein